MARLKKSLVVIGRVIQISLGTIATGFNIFMCMAWETTLGVALSATYCSATVAVCGLLVLLAMKQKDNVHWAMVLTLDLLALICSIAAAAVLTFASDDTWWYFNSYSSQVALYPPLVMIYICMATLLALAFRSFLMLRDGRRSLREVQIKEVDQSESWYPPAELQYTQPQHQHQYVAPVQPRFSEDHDKQVQTPISPRPVSTVESMAHWSTVSGGATLTQPPSIRSFDAKRPPSYSYASPVPSRAPTTIHRKPVY